MNPRFHYPTITAAATSDVISSIPTFLIGWIWSDKKVDGLKMGKRPEGRVLMAVVLGLVKFRM
jgi:hypothetical protein